MFEESLVESRGLVGSGTQRWTALGSLTVQCALAGLLIAIPLPRPDVLRVSPVAPPLALPLLRRPPAPGVTKTAVGSSSAMGIPAAGPATIALGQTIWPHRGELAEGPAPGIDLNLRMGLVISKAGRIESLHVVSGPDRGYWAAAEEKTGTAGRASSV